MFCPSLLDCFQQLPVFPLELSVSFLQDAVLLIIVLALAGVLLGGSAASSALGLFLLLSGEYPTEVQVIPEVLL